METGEVAGMSFESNRKGTCGRTSKLTEPVKEAYRKIIEKYAYS